MPDPEATTVTVSDVAADVGTSTGDARIKDCIDLALILVTELARADRASIPATAFDAAVRATAAAEFQRREAPNGVPNQAFADALADNISVPVRVADDPLRAARQILSVYLVPVVG